MPQSERRWIEGAHKLDEAVLGEIYDALSPELYRYAYRLVGNVEQAEDLLSETFLRFLRAIQAGGGPQRHLRAYLYRTLHNLLMDRHRRREPVWVELKPAQISTGEGGNPATSLQQQLEEQEARSYLWHLTAEQRQVILLKFFQDLSNTEIAAVLEKTEGAVKALQHRGLASLRRLIEKGSIDQEKAE
jgi:RNA polymerase sigma-70 factor (ECF subfamily)